MALLRIAILGLLLLHFSGCTVVLGGMGASADQKAEPKKLPYDPYVNAKADEKRILEVHNKEGEIYRGTFQSIKAGNTTDYAKQLRAYLETHNIQLPQLGKITVINPDRRKTYAHLIGYDRGRLMVQTSSENIPRAWKPNDAQIIVDDQKSQFSGEAVKALTQDPELPLISELYLNEGEETLKIPMKQISEIFLLQYPNSGKNTGIAAGLIIDTLIIASIIVARAFVEEGEDKVEEIGNEIF